MGLLGVAFVLAQAPLCVPGTTVCAESDGRGGVRLDASGRGRAGPNGANASGQAGAGANASGNADASANAGGEARNDYTGGSGGYYRARQGRFGTGVTLCPIARVGVWSGLKVGGCVALGFRWEAAAFEMETQLLYGGSTRAFDW